MKAVILSAGKGERLGEVTRKIPKPMIKIDGKPILERNIAWCRSFGIKDILINLHHLPEVITTYFKDGSSFGVSITYEHEVTLLGTSGAVKNFERYLKDEPFLVLYGDNAFDYDLRAFINVHQQMKPDMTLAVFHLDDVRHSGVVKLDQNGFVSEFVEKPTSPLAGGGLVNAGLYLMEPRLLHVIPAGFSDFGKDIFPALLKKGAKIFADKMDHSLRAIDTPDMLKKWTEDKGS